MGESPNFRNFCRRTFEQSARKQMRVQLPCDSLATRAFRFYPSLRSQPRSFNEQEAWKACAIVVGGQSIECFGSLYYYVTESVNVTVSQAKVFREQPRLQTTNSIETFLIEDTNHSYLCPLVNVADELLFQ